MKRARRDRGRRATRRAARQRSAEPRRREAGRECRGAQKQRVEPGVIEQRGRRGPRSPGEPFPERCESWTGEGEAGEEGATGVWIGATGGESLGDPGSQGGEEERGDTEMSLGPRRANTDIQGFDF